MPDYLTGSGFYPLDIFEFKIFRNFQILYESNKQDEAYNIVHSISSIQLMAYDCKYFTHSFFTHTI